MHSKKIYVSNITITKESSADNYPYNIPSIRNIDDLHFKSEVTFITGENGVGKSTLLEAIAANLGFNTLGGTKNTVSDAADSDLSSLKESIKITRTFSTPKEWYYFRAESLNQLSKYIDEVGYLDGYNGSMSQRSHGEAAFSIFNNKLSGHGFYLFDEPESALSFNYQLALLSRIDELAKHGSQMIICTHSPILLSYPHANIYELSEIGYQELSYEETSQFQNMKAFINNYKGFMRRILS
ncbi:hypothetical protein ST37_16460 [Vibrio sp. qd031]|uniref:AAA family ATPase n=1 Tax=Vibrio sp. qd031 TaxID=1603038 RepID=UPI000A10BEBD|nr:AAA family ATPase [Vibrio sp. qd031]ORT48675.1 hypothetical protein ST37_16460 [Vibrio sp. qd031]